MKLLTVDDIARLVAKHSLKQLLADLIQYLWDDFSRWHEFHKVARHAAHFPGGVIELMPIWDDHYYSFKYVNGHPNNPVTSKQTVIAFGVLAEVVTGYPLLLSEMTLLTAFRTAALSALATQLMARPGAETVAIIGTGAQSEFQISALHVVRSIARVYYYDIDVLAMRRFAHNLKESGLTLVPCRSAEEAVSQADIIVTATASKEQVHIVKNHWLSPGVHINDLGGDCPGKTELDPEILVRSRVVVEYIPQSIKEGEMQQFSEQRARELIYAELWELVVGNKRGREHQDEITLFDSVGFALEDYSVLRLIYDLCGEYQIGQECHLMPTLEDPKNLISLLYSPNIQNNFISK